VKLDPNTQRKYDRAKTQVLFRNQFFGSLMLQCRHIFTEDIPTMATDGRDILFNPNWIKDLEVEELMGVIVHEICHKVFLHIIRAKSLCGKDRAKLGRFNRAADYALNPSVKEAGFALPEGALLDDQYEGLLAEEIYLLLPEDEEYEDHFVFSDMSNEQIKDLTRQIKIEMAAAEATAGGTGNIPGSIKKLLEDNAKTKVDWKAVLADFIEDSIMGDDDITFKRPNRRMLVHDLYLPSTEGVQVPPICISFDTSGSIYAYPEVVQQFTTEIQSIVDHMAPEAVHLICNDTRVQSHEVYEQGEELMVELTGGGCTCFIECFKHVKDLTEHEPKVHIVFTDLEFDYNAVESEVPVLWVTYGKPHTYEPAIGTVVHIEG